MINLSVPLVLASQSPRRKRLLEQIGVSFIVDPSTKPEVWPENVAPEGAVQKLALQKAEDVGTRHPDSVVIGADTIVLLDSIVLGKPADSQQASEMLTKLSGRTHTVLTGLAILDTATGRNVQTLTSTQVSFGNLTQHEIDTYVSTGSPLDKAGGYGIQDDLGALLIECIDGDYYNVVGMPLRTLYLTLTRHFSDLVQPIR